MPSPARPYLDRWARLDALRRTNWDTDFIDMAAYMAPTRQLALLGTIAGAKITSLLFDSEGVTAPALLASSLHGNLSNPSTKWFTFEMRQPELNADNAVQDWLEDTARRVDRCLSASNFHNQMGEFYLDLPVFGTAALLEEFTPARHPQEAPTPLFTCLPIGTYGIAENAKGDVDTLYYRVQISARAALQQFGEDVHKDVAKLALDKPDDLLWFVHAIFPRHERDRTPGARNGKNKPFGSVWVDEHHEVIVREGGYEEFPGAVTRWRKQTGEVYGRGQGHLAIPDIKTLNKEVELLLLGMALDIAPPTFELERAVVGDLAWEPLARNVVRFKDAVWTIPSGVKYDVAKLAFDRLETKIRKAFFVDQILALPPPDQPSYMTAFEVAKRVEQEFKTLGAAYGRIVKEGHVPIIERTARALGRAGALRPPPAALLQTSGADMDIKFLGPMARAQEAETLVGISQKNIWLQGQLQMHPNDPSVLDNFDEDAEALVVARGYGVPATVTRGKDAVAAIRKARAEAQAQAAKEQQLHALAESAGKAAPMVKALKGGAPEQGATP